MPQTLDGLRRRFAGHSQADLLDALAVAHLGQPALVHHEHAVVQREDLVEVLAEEKNGGALLRRVEEVPVNRLDRGDVESTRRRRRDENAQRSANSRAITTF